MKWSQLILVVSLYCCNHLLDTSSESLIFSTAHTSCKTLCTGTNQSHIYIVILPVHLMKGWDDFENYDLFCLRLICTSVLKHYTGASVAVSDGIIVSWRHVVTASAIRKLLSESWRKKVGVRKLASASWHQKVDIRKLTSKS